MERRQAPDTPAGALPVWPGRHGRRRAGGAGRARSAVRPRGGRLAGRHGGPATGGGAPRALAQPDPDHDHGRRTRAASARPEHGAPDAVPPRRRQPRRPSRPHSRCLQCPGQSGLAARPCRPAGPLGGPGAPRLAAPGHAAPAGGGGGRWRPHTAAGPHPGPDPCAARRGRSAGAGGRRPPPGPPHPRRHAGDDSRHGPRLPGAADAALGGLDRRQRPTIQGHAMSVQWFPGHMHATRKAIAERMKVGIDVVIELLDARLPGSSATPLLAEMTSRRPTLKVLNKQDLADPGRTAQWLAHYNAQPDTRAIGLDASEAAPAQKLLASCRELAPLRGGMAKPLRILICGVPNVGKSTLVNTLAGARPPRPVTRPASPRTSSASTWPPTPTCSTRPACCGPRSSRRAAASTWPPVAPWAATPTTNKRSRWSCWRAWSRPAMPRP